MFERANRFLVVVWLVTLCAGYAHQALAENVAADFLSVPAGVFDLEYNNGLVMRLKVKGESEISSVLSATKAKRVARDKAIRDAKSLFSQWLKEEVTVVEQAEEVMIIQEVDGKASAQVLDVSSEKYQSFSENLLRGLIVLWELGEGDTYTVVMGWSQKLAAATEGVARQNANPQLNESKAASDTTASKDSAASRRERGAKDIDDF